MEPQTVFFHGVSGAGKGTQAKLLNDYLQTKDPQNEVIYLSTGQLGREFTKLETFAARRIKALLDEGGLFPDFFPIGLWSDYLNRTVKTGREHLIFDGVGRRAPEGPMMTSALDFFERKDPVVIVLNVSRERAVEHLKKRGRYDDNDIDIKSRLDWYETQVVPVIDYFRSTPRYRVEDVDGEQGIEEVHQEILRRLKL